VSQHGDDFDDPDFESAGERLESSGERHAAFGAALLRVPLSELSVRPTPILSAETSVTEAMRAMQREHRGCVLVTDDGSSRSKLIGIFTERDVLFRIVDRGRKPQSLPLGQVMTPDPESLSVRSTVAYALNKMSVGGYRHVPVVDDEHRPCFVVAVKDVVEFLVAAFPREVLNLPVHQKTQRSREGA
jgi:CBS domain-containing protein